LKLKKIQKLNEKLEIEERQKIAKQSVEIEQTCSGFKLKINI
jgi:hypothetical protein